VFDFLSCPGRSSQEFEAGLHRRIIVKTSNIDTYAQLIPAIMLNQAVDDLFQCHTVQRIIHLLFTHDSYFALLITFPSLFIMQ